MTSYGAKYLSPEEFEKAIAGYYDGDTGKVHTVMVLASKARHSEEGMYIPRKPYAKRKDVKETPWIRFRAMLDEIGQGGVAAYLCERFPLTRVKIARTISGYPDRLVLTPGDDARVSSELEKMLRNAVGKDAFTLAKEEWIRLLPHIPKDDSGQMRMAAIDLIVINRQLNGLDIQISTELKGATDENNKPVKGGAGSTAGLFDQKKVLLLRKDAILKQLGLNYDDIAKRTGTAGSDLASAAEALKDMIGERIATADIIEEAREVHNREDKIEKGEAPQEIDAIDMARLKQAAVKIETNVPGDSGEIATGPNGPSQ